MKDNKTTLEDALEHNLTEEEFLKIQEILKRVPNKTELGIFSAMWSEHCSYKNSILKLKTLPNQSEKTLVASGEENAGALDIGDGLCVVFKIESHNHPTAVEPYQGAATGVGGIMRDIFTMGARPIVSLNSLRFGHPKEKRNRYLLTQAIKGIGDYGNSLGIAVSGGEVFIDESFSENPLVNAMSVGIAKHTSLTKATTKGAVGNSVFLLGAKTGRDGIHGASFASQDISEETNNQRSAVQVGDPFMEKLLLEASLEAIEKKILVGIQDMGAAGISCSSSEMSAKENTGIEINLDFVPIREKNMNAYEIMLSESQERMLAIPKKGKEKELISIFEKWNLEATKIGKVTDDGLMHIIHHNETQAKIPAQSLVLGGGAPQYEREKKKPAYLDEVKHFDFTKENQDIRKEEIPSILEKMITNLNITSKKDIIEQYDTEVGLVKIIGPGLGAGLSLVPNTTKGIATTTDCNSRFVHLEPYWGTVSAVCEAARNIVCTGAEPYGVTNNLNFANPYIPENYYIFSECVRGLKDACEFFNLPVTGGNVSFYNESDKGPILPSPVIGMVGLLEHYKNTLLPYPKEENLGLALVGKFQPSLSGSEYVKEFYHLIKGSFQQPQLEIEKNLFSFILELNTKNFLKSANDLSLGGLLVGLCKIAVHSKLGLNLDFSYLQKNRLDELLFGETHSCILISYSKEKKTIIQKKAETLDLEFFEIGFTRKEKIIQEKSLEIQFFLEKISEFYESGFSSYF